MDSSGDKKKQEDGLARAAQGSRDTSQDVLVKKMVENRKLKEELKQLQDELAAQETTRKDLETKLDKRDIAHNQHLEAQLSDIRAAHKIELEAKETLLQAALIQKEKDRQTAADELGKRETELKSDLEKKEHENQKVLKLFVSKEEEIQKLKENKTTEAKNSDDQKKQLQLQLEEAEKKHKQQLANTQAEQAQTVTDLKLQLTEAQGNVGEMKEKCAKEMKEARQVQAGTLKKMEEEKQQRINEHDTAIKNLEKHAEEVQFQLEQQLQSKNDEMDKLRNEKLDRLAEDH